MNKITEDLLTVDYLENRLSLEDLEAKYSENRRSILYRISKTGFTRASYLRHRYSKEMLGELLLTNTFESLATKLKLTVGELRVLLKHKGITRDTKTFYKKNIVNPYFYNSTEYEKEFYYFVGLFVTDGCFAGKNQLRIAICNKGAESLLKKLANIAGHDNVKAYKNGFFSLSFSDEGLKQKLISLGIPEKNKTYQLKDVYIPNEDCLYSFLCGALDGDGHIGFQKSIFGYRVALDYSLCNYNVEFLLNLKSKIHEIGFEAKVNNNQKQGVPVLTIGTRANSEEFYKKMYSKSPLKLECKHQIYLSVINKVMI